MEFLLAILEHFLNMRPIATGIVAASYSGGRQAEYTVRNQTLTATRGTRRWAKLRVVKA